MRLIIQSIFSRVNPLFLKISGDFAELFVQFIKECPTSPEFRLNSTVLKQKQLIVRGKCRHNHIIAYRYSQVRIYKYCKWI